MRVVLVAILASQLLLPACISTNRMSHIRKNVTTEGQWFVTGMGAKHAAPHLVRAEPAERAKPAGEIPLDERAVLAVMAIEDSSAIMDSGLLANAQEMLRGKLSATGYFVVIDRGRQEEKLNQLVRAQKKESYRECYDESCQIPLGQALAADSILRTTISCLGNSCMLSCELVELEKEAATIGGTADFDNSDVATLKTALDSVVTQLAQGIQRTF
jgi:hypothetical protein